VDWKKRQNWIYLELRTTEKLSFFWQQIPKRRRRWIFGSSSSSSSFSRSSCLGINARRHLLLRRTSKSSERFAWSIAHTLLPLPLFLFIYFPLSDIPLSLSLLQLPKERLAFALIALQRLISSPCHHWIDRPWRTDEKEKTISNQMSQRLRPRERETEREKLLALGEKEEGKRENRRHERYGWRGICVSRGHLSDPAELQLLQSSPSSLPLTASIRQGVWWDMSPLHLHSVRNLTTKKALKEQISKNNLIKKTTTTFWNVINSGLNCSL